MSGFVHKLRQKPQDVKNKIAIISAMSITLLIVGVWILIRQNSNIEKEVLEGSGSEDLKPLMIIFGNAKKGFNDIRENINSQKEDNQ